MLYRNRSDGAILSQGEVRKLHANTSLPAVWDQTVCEDLGIDPILSSPQPTPGPLESVRQDGVIQDSLGNWVENWILVPMFSEYTKEDGTVVTKEEQEQAYLAQKDAEKAAQVRSERDKKLAESDWMVIKAYETNTNIPAVWEIYRQALRDITAQPGFPNEVTWPTKPGE